MLTGTKILHLFNPCKKAQKCVIVTKKLDLFFFKHVRKTSLTYFNSTLKTPMVSFGNSVTNLYYCRKIQSCQTLK